MIVWIAGIEKRRDRLSKILKIKSIVSTPEFLQLQIHRQRALGNWDV